MELNYLKEFVILAEEKQYVSASQKAFISQSTLSRHIQALEKELGCTLFVRSTREVALSEEGKLLLPYARNVIDNISLFAKDLDKEKSKNNTSTTIGIVHDPDKWDVTKYLYEFNSAYPDTKINLFESNISDLKAQFDGGKLHVITICYPCKEPLPKRYVICGISGLVALVPKTNPLSSKEQLSLDDLREQPLFLPKEQHITYQYFMRAIKAKNIEPNIVYTGNSRGIIELVKNKNGIVIQDKYIAQEQLDDDFVIIPFTPTINYYYGIEYSSRLNDDEKAFVRYIKQRCKNIVIK